MSTPPRHNLAMLLVRMERLDAAETESRSVIENEPTLAAALFALGVLLQECEVWDESALLFERCLASQPNYPGALRALAYSYARGDADDGLARANALLERAVSAPQSAEEALTTLITLNLELGRHDIAHTWATIAVHRIPQLAQHETIRALLEGQEGRNHRLKTKPRAASPRRALGVGGDRA